MKKLRSGLTQVSWGDSLGDWGGVSDWSSESDWGGVGNLEESNVLLVFSWFSNFRQVSNHSYWSGIMGSVWSSILYLNENKSVMHGPDVKIANLLDNLSFKALLKGSKLEI